MLGADLVIHYCDMLKDFLNAEPGSERAKELRFMIRLLEHVCPELEQERINEMVRRERVEHGEH